MGDNFREFSLDLEAFADQVDVDVGVVTRKVALQALRGVVLRTPVDKGRARGGWQVEVGEGSDGEADRQDTGGGLVIADGAVRIAQAKPYEAVDVLNNVSYINALEHGSSAQAPAGMVAVTVAEIETTLAIVTPVDEFLGRA